MNNEDELMHFGRSKRNGAPGPGSGRYPLGSGKNPRAMKSTRSKAEKAQLKALRKDEKEKRKRARDIEKATKANKKAEDELAKAEKKAAEERAKRDKNFVNQRDARDANKLTNQELIERTNRLQLESNYKQGMERARGREQVARNIIKDAASTALKGAATAAFIYLGKEALAKIFKAEPSWRGNNKARMDEILKGYGGGGGGNKKKK